MRLWPCLLLLAGSIVADEDLIVKDYVTGKASRLAVVNETAPMNAA